MTVALVTDWLTTPGGAEKVLLELHKMYPDAPIYTSQYRPKKIDWFKDATVKTGWLNLFPAGLRKILGPLRQLYFSHLNLSHYDLVISVTGAEAKSVRTVAKPYRSKTGKHHEIILPPPHRARHLCYCHAPTQYYWQLYDEYLAHPGFGFFDPVVRFFFKLFVGPLRQADYAAAQRPDQFITISEYSAAAIQKFYHRDSVIIAPPVDLEIFSTSFPPDFHSSTPVKPAELTEAPHFIIACRQVTWKRVDLAISACLATGQPLTVIGDGPEHDRLVALAAESSLITFRPWLSAPELAAELRSARAYLFPSLEPFGIAAVEALAAGCPVIAYADGGSRDFVTPGKNGLLFAAQTVDSLSAALEEFSTLEFDPATVAATAAPFSAHRFQTAITRLAND